MIFTGSNGPVTVEFTVDDATLAVTDVHVINNADRPQIIEFLNEDGSVKFTSQFGPRSDLTRNIPPGQRVTAVQKVITKPDGSTKISIEFLYRFGDMNLAAQHAKV